MATARKRDRVTVTLSLPMRLALEHLAARHGLATATEATMILRQGLDRTINTDALMEKVREHKAQRTAEQWRDEVQIDHAVEATFHSYPPADLQS